MPEEFFVLRSTNHPGTAGLYWYGPVFGPLAGAKQFPTAEAARTCRAAVMDALTKTRMATLTLEVVKVAHKLEVVADPLILPEDRYVVVDAHGRVFTHGDTDKPYTFSGTILSEAATWSSRSGAVNRLDGLLRDYHDLSARVLRVRFEELT